MATRKYELVLRSIDKNMDIAGYEFTEKELHQPGKIDHILKKTKAYIMHGIKHENPNTNK